MKQEESVLNDHISRRFGIKVQSVYHTLKTAERKAVDYILGWPELAAYQSVVETALQAKCSEATLVRLARKLGYSGYPEMKTSILLRVDEPTSVYGEILPKDDASGIAGKVFSACIQSLTDTMNLIDGVAYQTGIDLMSKAERFLFIGVGDANAVAYASYLKFMRIGLRATCPQDYDIQLIEASQLKKDDILFVISHSGQTKTVCDIIKCARTTGAKSICITNYPLSHVAKLSDVVLQTAAFTPDVYGEVTSKRVIELCMIESLYITLLSRLDKKYLVTLNNSNDAALVNKY